MGWTRVRMLQSQVVETPAGCQMSYAAGCYYMVEDATAAAWIAAGIGKPDAPAEAPPAPAPAGRPARTGG